MSISLKHPLSIAGLFSFAALFFSGAAFAEKTSSKTSPEAKQLKQSIEQAKTACASDIEKLCSDITPGEGRIMDCLDSKSDKLSTECASSRNDAKAQASKMIDKAQVAFRKNCGSDVQKFCSDIPAGKGRLFDCLSLHEDHLSKSCKNFQARVSQKVDEAWA